MQRRKEQYKKSAGLRNVVNPFDLVDADSEDILAEGDISTEIVIALRKAHKRNAISRLKALEELKNILLSKEKSAEINSAAFAKHLLRLFVKVSMDPERNIRESAFDLFWTLCNDTDARRCLSFIISELAFYWIGAFFDPARLVADLAQKSFGLCFSSEEKVSLFINSVQKSMRRHIIETLEFRAEDARKAAMSDAELSEIAQILFSLHVSRAISAECFLAQHLEFNSEIFEQIMQVLEVHGTSLTIVNNALYQYALAVKIPSIQAEALLKMAISDIANAESVLQLLRVDDYRDVSLDPNELGEYFKQCVSNHSKSIIHSLKRTFQQLDAKCQSICMSSVLHPNTLDSSKLSLLIEELFPLANIPERGKIFDVIVVKREAPWSNMEVLNALDSLRKAFGEEFVTSQVSNIDCTRSVPLLLYSFKKGLIDARIVVSCFEKLELSQMHLALILSDKILASEKCVLDLLFEPYKRAVDKGQLTGFMGLFDIERLLRECERKDHMLSFLLQMVQKALLGNSPLNTPLQTLCFLIRLLTSYFLYPIIQMIYWSC